MIIVGFPFIFTHGPNAYDLMVLIITVIYFLDIIDCPVFIYLKLYYR
jgi:hypothetical protein